ncbi:DEAD/DEAH box helicase [Corynebacterium sp. P8-C1]|uniref:DEAD/DEAH box helicase n=1 Tax=Corynebacterium sp. P8-C1 TaxID=3059082 RepID=UPI00265D3C4D|nr:DEAD/DEAH box helicase [Corynebacterium sp. P8-C1]WKK63743.1 DEAD/DEAH box helicase [Corynebacterium sp. P8-C1]
MPKFLLHGLWLPATGLNLWVERVDGHKILMPSQVPKGTFPPMVENMLEDSQFRRRDPITLQTPRGKQLQLRVPTAAFSPEETVAFLSQIALLDDASPAATAAQREAIAPDLYWIIRLHVGLTRFVRAGRVSIRVRPSDSLWYPEWQLGTGLEERGWLASMIAAAPGVVTANNLNLAEDVATTLVHWIASAHLSHLKEQTRAYPWHDFADALLSSQPLRRGGSSVSKQIAHWNGSITAVNVQLVFIVEEPSDPVQMAHEADPADAMLSELADITGTAGKDAPLDPAKVQWPVRAQVRAGTDAPRPIHLDRVDMATLSSLRDQLRRAVEVTSLVDPERHPRLPQTPLTDRDGDWDAYLGTDELMELVARDATRLQMKGITVMLPRAWQRMETTAKLTVGSREEDGADAATTRRFGVDQLISYDWSLSVGDTELTQEEMRQLVESKSGLIQLRGQWVMADSRSLAKSRKYIESLSEKEVEDGVITAEELRQLALEAAAESEGGALEIAGDVDSPAWMDTLIGGTDRPAPERQPIPDTVHAELRDYQRRGVDWLYFMSRNHLGAVLADDMGLGKTLQLLTLLAVEADKQVTTGPTLVVAPTSVVGNWAREAQRFVPGMRVGVHHGPGRLKGDALIEEIGQLDLLITSYGVVTRDFKQLGLVEWDHVVLDEAQAIKNTGTRASQSVRAIGARHRIALTGTPVENRLAELRSLLDFVNPGILGSQSFFRNHFSKVIETRRDEELADEMQARLQRLTAPFVLRRLKTDPAIISDLPEKSEQVVPVDMTDEQAALYTALIESMKKELEQRTGMARKGLVLSTITRIKQICNHPAHFLGDGSPVTIKGAHRSGKVKKLLELIDVAIETDQRVLVFTQYKAFGDILQPYLSDRLGQTIPFLHGGVSKTARDAMVDEFQDPNGPRAMILSLRAGGTGLNLTAASMVVHMDRWWNPAVENQATDRAYRIGQAKNVQVYKMITRGTMEESIQDILDGKLQLAGAVVGEGEGWITELDTDDLATLMSYRGTEGE